VTSIWPPKLVAALTQIELGSRNGSQKTEDERVSFEFKNQTVAKTTQRCQISQKRETAAVIDLTCFLGLKAEPLLQNYAKVKANLSLCQDKFKKKTPR